ncbi:hypothetical protein CCACVL1_23602 [Corchorus capsularis]|uniref:Endonuclease/exonuclease/phosphatase n=1 Tax=Corchorus capsularis TaxID=210143 RepID=A0A1R3GT74_COCAP|nr:hypothetical protein CCACVL1_23602 [Corchorus capsularis]
MANVNSPLTSFLFSSPPPVSLFTVFLPKSLKTTFSHFISLLILLISHSGVLDLSPPPQLGSCNSPLLCISSQSRARVHSIMYIILNARGAYNPDFIFRFAELTFEHQPDIVIVTETRLSGEEDRIARESMTYTGAVSLQAVGYFGGIWFLWKQNKLQLRTIRRADQSITLQRPYASSAQTYRFLIPGPIIIQCTSTQPLRSAARVLLAKIKV